jgi:ribosomal protein L11 methyltransferase
MKASSTGSVTPSAELIRLAADVPADRAEMAIAAACAVLGTGCRETPGAPGLVRLEFWISPARADVAATRLAALVAPLGGTAVTRAVEDPGWQTAMRDFHQPVEILGGVRVRPPWHPAVGDAIDVVIDPAMAFGTGQHDTTRGCLELLVGLAPGRLIDIGCGSGVLAIAAAKLGHRPVWAWDLDPLAVAATVANASHNGVALTVACRNVLEAPLPDADVVLANLTANLLGPLAAHVAAHPPQAAILSGLRPFEIDSVCAQWAATGLRRIDARIGAEWGSVLLARR